MTYNVFGGTLSLTQSVIFSVSLSLCLIFTHCKVQLLSREAKQNLDVEKAGL